MTGPEPAHVADDLPALLAGECGRQQTLALAAHLRACPECRAELVSVVVASGVLRSAARAEQLPARAEQPQPQPQPFTPTQAEPPASSDPEAPSTSPVSADSPAPEWLSGIAGRKPRRRLAAVAAAVVILAGAAAAALGLAGSGPSVLTRAALHPLQAPAGASGKVTVTAVTGARDVAISTAGLPAPGQGHYYEVWLLNPATLKMMPMGALPPSGQASFSVASGLTTGYSAVDISLQANNGNPAHSAVSVLRGTLGT